MINLIPGVMISGSVAGFAYLLHLLPFAPFTVEGRHPVDPLLLALVLGALCRALLDLPGLAFDGVRWSSKRLLALSIVLLGAKLNFSVILKHSHESLWLSLSCVMIALTLTQFLGRYFGVQARLSKLIAIGTAICGGTAIAVTSAPLKATEEEVALSMGTVTLFGLICVFVMPPIGVYLSLTESEFGLWSGLVVHATPQVMATAYSYGGSAGEVALIVKMTRILLLAPLLIYLNLSQSRIEERTSIWSVHMLTKLCPPFLIGFLFLALLNTYQLIPEEFLSSQVSVHSVLTHCSKGLMMIAMSAIGLMVKWRSLVTLGPKPALIGLISTLVISISSLLLIK